MSANLATTRDPAWALDRLGKERPRLGKVTPVHPDREVTTTQARLSISHLLAGAEFQGRRIVITRRGKVVAALVPAADLVQLEVHDGG